MTILNLPLCLSWALSLYYYDVGRWYYEGSELSATVESCICACTVNRK